jgi:D-alanyl-D-alanine carboxypeptidase
MLKKALLFFFVMALALAVASCGNQNDKPAVTTAPTTTTQPVITLGTTTAPINVTTTSPSTTTVPVGTTQPTPTTTAPSNLDIPSVTLPLTGETLLTPPEVTSLKYEAQKPIVVADEFLLKIEQTKGDVYRGNLLLINNNYPVRNETKLAEECMSEIYGSRILVDEKPIYGLRNVASSHKADVDLINALNEMIKAYYEESAESFIFLTIYDEYRPYGYQQTRYEKAYKTYAEDTYMYEPKAGYSEYQSGLAILFKMMGDDGLIYEMNSSVARPALQWLEANAHKYGFIFRYPTDKRDITEMKGDFSQYQLRYVGKAHSLFMKEYDLCLEEYMTFLKNFHIDTQHLLVTVGFDQYESFYVPVAEDITEIKFAKDAQYEVSGNNVDGFIVTLYRDISAKKD